MVRFVLFVRSLIRWRKKPAFGRSPYSRLAVTPERSDDLESVQNFADDLRTDVSAVDLNADLGSGQAGRIMMQSG